MNKKKLTNNHGSPSNIKNIQECSIGIIGWNSPRFSESHQGFIDLLKNSISTRHGNPFFFGISGSLEGAHSQSNGKKQSLHYGLPSRDMIADQIELIIYNEQLKGLLLIPWSINSLVGMLMASARCNIPTLFLPQYSLWNSGINSFSYADYSLPLLLEVLGLTRIGTLESFAAQNKDNSEFAQWGSERILEMVKQNMSSRRFFSSAAFNNSLCVDLSLGGCTETVLHLSAIAQEADFTMPLSMVNELSKKVPQLVPQDKSGEFNLEEFEKWGGLNSLLSTLVSFLQPSPTSTGRNIVDIAKSSSHNRSNFKLNHTYGEQGSLGALTGSLARDGALMRGSSLKKEWLSYSGPVKVFNSEDSLIEAIQSKKIKKGDILILRYCGPRGNPGMPAMSAPLEALREKNLEESVAILTDGRLKGTGNTPAIVHISPEAAVGSPLSIIQDGDIVQWNFQEKSLNARLTDTEIRVRLSRWKEQEQRLQNSFLGRYSKYSSSSALGATLK